MNILLLGSGGREHALAWKIAQSAKCEKLFIAPGNAGTNGVGGKGVNVDIKADDFENIKQFIVDNGVNMVVVGPEDPLVKGIYDDLGNDSRTKNIPVIGPSKQGAVLEGSKDFAKAFMKRHNIPTAAYETFDGEHLEEGLKLAVAQDIRRLVLAVRNGLYSCAEDLGKIRGVVQDEAQDQRRQLTARDHIIADRDLLEGEFVEHPLVHTLVVSAEYYQIVFLRKLLDKLLVELSALRGHIDKAGVSVLAEVSYYRHHAVVYRLCLHHHARAAAVCLVIHTTVLVESVGADVAAGDLHRAGFAGAPYDALSEKCLAHCREKGRYVNPHCLLSPRGQKVRQAGGS